jgi:hypothetical protein
MSSTVTLLCPKNIAAKPFPLQALTTKRPTRLKAMPKKYKKKFCG